MTKQITKQPALISVPALWLFPEIKEKCDDVGFGRKKSLLPPGLLFIKSRGVTQCTQGIRKCLQFALNGLVQNIHGKFHWSPTPTDPPKHPSNCLSVQPDRKHNNMSLYTTLRVQLQGLGERLNLTDYARSHSQHISEFPFVYKYIYLSQSSFTGKLTITMQWEH